MFSHLKRVTTLTLLASAVSCAYAAPAPVADLNPSSSNAYRVIDALPTNTAGSAGNEADSVLKARVRVQLQMQQQIDELSQEVSTLRGQLEQNQHEMQQMAQRQRDLFVALDKLRNGADTDNAPTSVDSANDATEAKAAAEGTFSVNAEEQKAYQAAVDLILKQRDYQGATVAFQQFQKTYPDSSFTANSHYWLGQLSFAQKQDKEAAEHFAAVLSYASSPKRADALLKLGDIAERHQRAEQAKKFYQQVVSEYPNSSAAKLAQPKLK